MLKKLNGFVGSLGKKAVAFVAVAVAYCTALATYAQESTGGLAIVTKESDGSVSFDPSVMASPMIDTVISCVKWGALIAFIVIGAYIVIRLISRGHK